MYFYQKYIMDYVIYNVLIYFGMKKPNSIF